MKYLAHYAANNEYEFFSTFEEAKKWLEDLWGDDVGDEGFAEETISGQDFIARITHVSEFTEIGNKEKDGYQWNEDAQGYFIDGDPEKEEWPVSDHFDFYGDVKLKEVKDDKDNRSGK